MKLLLVLCLFCPAVAQAATPQAPPVRPCPPQAPPVRPEPTQQTELRSIGGVIYSVPVETPWSETTKFKPYLLLPSGTQPDCPVGQP